MSRTRAFFSTVPGVVSVVAALVTALVGLLTLSTQLGWFDGDDGDDTTTSVTGGADAPGSGAGGSGGTSAGGGAAELVADKATLTFVPLRTKELTVTVRNEGTAPATLARPQITGPDRSQYAAAYDTNCPTPLRANRSCTVTVTFKPTKQGESRATLVVEPEEDDAKAVEVALEGNHLL